MNRSSEDVAKGIDIACGVTELPIFDALFKNDPHPLYARLRAQGSLAPAALPSGMRFWLVTRHAASRLLLADSRLAKSEPASEVADGDSPKPARHPLFDHLLTNDPPAHTRWRALLAPHFTSRRIQAMRPSIERRARQLLESIAPRGAMDLLAEVASPLAFEVACDVVGIPEQLRSRLQRHLADLEAADMESAQATDAVADRLGDLLVRASELSATCHEGDDVLFKSLRDAVSSGLLRADQVPALAFLVIAAGRETTANLLASGIWLLLSRPPAWERLHANSESVREVVEELLRLVHPLEMATLRYAVTDFEFDDVLIRQGDVVIVGIASANHDPTQFESAADFDPKRRNVSSHLSFGRGPHACIGAGLARLEADVVLTLLCRMFPDLQLASTMQVAWKPGLVSRGLQALNVNWTPPRHGH